IVDLVRSGVVEVLALEVDPMPRRLAQPRRQIQRRRTAHIIAQQPVELGVKAGVRASGGPRVLQLRQSRHQRLGDVLPAVGPESVLDRAHGVASGAGAVMATAAPNALSLSGSFRPGARSTPLATSTANGRTTEIASATLSGFSPPLRITGIRPR